MLVKMMIPALKIADSYSNDQREKANIFAVHFANVSSSANLQKKSSRLIRRCLKGNRRYLDTEIILTLF